MRTVKITLTLTVFFLSIGLSDSFTTSTSTTRTNSHNLLLLHLRREELVTPPSLCTEAKETLIDGAFTSLTNRRQLLSQTVSSLLLGTIAAVAGTSTAATISSPCWAADNNTPKTTSDTLWLTGKPPQKPGQSTTTKKSDSSVAGTRKDPNFLRSMADCRNQCENTVDADGYPRQRDECLATCQDVCCTTYEQCTASVKIR